MDSNHNGDRRNVETGNKYVAFCKCGSTLSTSNYNNAVKWIAAHQVGDEHYIQMADLLDRPQGD